MALAKHELGRIFDRDDAFVSGHKARQHIEERRLTGARATRDQHIQPAGDRHPQEIEHRLGQ
jgi:hypothetical protein